MKCSAHSRIDISRHPVGVLALFMMTGEQRSVCIITCSSLLFKVVSLNCIHHCTLSASQPALHSVAVCVAVEYIYSHTLTETVKVCALLMGLLASQRGNQSTVWDVVFVEIGSIKMTTPPTPPPPPLSVPLSLPLSRWSWASVISCLLWICVCMCNYSLPLWQQWLQKICIRAEVVQPLTLTNTSSRFACLAFNSLISFRLL